MASNNGWLSRRLARSLAVMALCLASPAFAQSSPAPAPLSTGKAELAAPQPEVPRRVVSMNLCTDQLAMLLAAPGQLVSVSILARDPLSSAMSDAAKNYPANHGLAEEIFLLRPDLVLAEPYTKPATVALLRQLGIRVELIDSANSLSEVRRAMIEVGTALGQESRVRADSPR